MDLILSPSAFRTGLWGRRQWLVAACLAGWQVPGRAQSAIAAILPVSRSLPDELAIALQKGQPLIVMASLAGCVFCRQARESHLSPMHQAGSSIVQIDLRSPQPVLNFAGQSTTHDQLARLWKISITPTLLFFGPGGKEVAERMEGDYQPDFYGPYLEERLAKVRKLL